MKATYLPIKGEVYYKNGGIVENPKTVMPTFRFGFLTPVSENGPSRVTKTEKQKF